MTQVVTTTIGGKTFRCSPRTEAHLLWTVERLAVDYPNASLRVIQGCYNTGVKVSAGTHDYDAVLDVQIVGLAWNLAQDWLRAHGWGAWVRQPPTFSWHIHMISLGYTEQVGVYVPGQVRDYYSHLDGLASHAPDPTWHPANIDATVFDYDHWLKEHDMTPAQETLLKNTAAGVDRLESSLLEFRRAVNIRFKAAQVRDLTLIRQGIKDGKTDDQLVEMLTELTEKESK